MLGEKEVNNPNGAATTVSDSTAYHLIDKQSHTGYAQVLEEIEAATGDVLKAYAIGHDVLAQHDTATGLVYFSYDGKGSTRALLDGAGFVVTPSGGAGQRFLYDAYGQMLAAGGVFALREAAITSLLNNGEQTDRLTGDQYLRARYYDVRTGRFNRLDPFAGNMQDPQSLHKYAFGHSYPVFNVDPTGAFAATAISTLGISAGQLANFAFVGSIAIGVTVTLKAVELVQTQFPWVLDGIAQGFEEAGDLLAKIYANMREFAAHVENAIEQTAVKIGTAIQQLRRMPVFPVIKSNGPAVFALDVWALSSNPKWYTLTYLGAGNPRTALNRAQVAGKFPYPRPYGFQVDEFPYASTAQGGSSSFAAYVPSWQNQLQGTLLSIFYGAEFKFRPGSFVVVPVPI